MSADVSYMSVWYLALDARRIVRRSHIPEPHSLLLQDASLLRHPMALSHSAHDTASIEARWHAVVDVMRPCDRLRPTMERTPCVVRREERNR